MAAPSDPRPVTTSRIGDGAFRLVVVMAVALLVLTTIRVVAVGDSGAGSGWTPPASPGPGAAAATAASSAPATPEVDVAAYLEPDPRPAPPIELDGPDGRFTLDAMRGAPLLVFFGYTHCPDVCPATIGTVGLAIDAYEREARAVLVSVDPERDTPAWLAEFVRYLPAGFNAVSGTPAQVRTTADAWGVRYAKVDTGDPAAYTMSHTADVFLVDAAGRISARFPFGTDAPTMTAVIDAVDPPPGVASEPPGPTSAPSPTAAPTPTPGNAPIADLDPVLVSSSVWAGPSSPVIFTLGEEADPAGRSVGVQLATAEGRPIGAVVAATAVRPPGIALVSYVAVLDVPSPGAWAILVSATDAAGGSEHTGRMPVTALDQGGSAALGDDAPTARTDTPVDVGGDLTWLTTDPLPDPRLHETSTSDALAAGRPFVLVVDSVSFKVTPQCGQAVVLAKRLVHRWTEVPFIHHEPYRYSVITTEPVLEGSLEAPHLTDVAEAWGVGDEPWGVASMPWLFVVDGDGIVRAKYQGVMGSADVDVMLALLTGDR